MAVRTTRVVTIAVECDVDGCEEEFALVTDDEVFEPFEAAREEGWTIAQQRQVCPTHTSEETT